MASIDDRLQRLEVLVDRLTPSLYERLERLEEAARAATARDAAPPAPATLPRRIAAAAGRFVAWAGGELPKFLSAAVLLVFGWGIKDSVDLSIKQRQLDLSYAKEMQGLLQKMSERGADFAQLESTAVVLSTYGEAALPALMSELRYTGLRADAAASGLASLALTQPAAVCEALPRVLSSRAQQYDWQAHRRVVRLLGANGCTGALPQLRHYRSLVEAAAGGNASGLVEFLREPPLAPAEDYPLLLETVDRTLRHLDGATAATGGRR